MATVRILLEGQTHFSREQLVGIFWFSVEGTFCWKENNLCTICLQGAGPRGGHKTSKLVNFARQSGTVNFWVRGNVHSLTAAEDRSQPVLTPSREEALYSDMSSCSEDVKTAMQSKHRSFSLCLLSALVSTERSFTWPGRLSRTLSQLSRHSKLH